MSDEPETIDPISPQEARRPFNAIPVVAAAQTTLKVIGLLAIGLMYFIPVVSLIVWHWLGLNVPSIALAAVFFALVVVAVGLKWRRRGAQGWGEPLLVTGAAIAAILLVLCLLGVL